MGSYEYELAIFMGGLGIGYILGGVSLVLAGAFMGGANQ